MSKDTGRGSNWYPTLEQLKDPAATHRAFKQTLDQFYVLQDSHAKLQASHDALAAKVPDTSKGGPPPGSGPTDTQLLGLRVVPVDSQSLANGATLKYNKANGNFEFV